MQELLLVGVGVMGRPYLAAAARLGVQVHAVESPARAAGLAGAVDHVTLTSGESDECWAQAAAAAAAARPPDGVLAFAEPQALAAALVAERAGLPGPSLHATVLSRNKALQRGAFAAAGIRQPEHVVVAGPADAAEWADTRFPVVLKPLSATGSEGVEQVGDPAGYAEAVLRRTESPLLVEAAVEGPEYSWEALVQDGRIVFANLTAKETTGPPRFVETGHRTGVVLGGAADAAVADLGRQVLAALRMGSGVVHLEFRTAASGPTLMEVAVRTPGDFLMELLGCTYGFDWFEMAVRLAMAMPLPELPPPAPAACSVGHFPITAPGTVVAIDGLEEVRAHPAVLRAGVLAEIGDVVPPVVSSAQRRIYVLLTSSDPAVLDDGLELARRTLVVRTTPV